MSENHLPRQVERRVRSKINPDSLAERVYRHIKQEIFNFHLLPGDRFTESEVAQRVRASRTPVREALYRLQREGYVDVLYRAGWRVKPFDFRCYEEMYDVRIVIELAALRKLCERKTPSPLVEDLKQVWLVPESEWLSDPVTVSLLDERFHEFLVVAAGNVEMARIHHALTERLRIIRRLDFTYRYRVEATYREHAAILQSVLKCRVDQAQLLMKSHIESSKAEVRKITLHMLCHARHALAGDNGEK